MDCVIEQLMIKAGDTYATMSVRLWRPDGAPRGTVFCIHGFEGNGAEFDYLARHLVRQGYSVVCPDMLGRGQSTYFGEHAKYTLNLYATCIGALSKYATGKTYFIGTSWGGAVTIFFLSKTRIKIEKLLLNDVVLRTNPAELEYVDFMVSDIRREFDTREQAYAYVRKSRDYLGTFDEELWPPYLASKIRQADGKYRLAYDPVLMDHAITVKDRRYNLFPALERIEGEILLMYGQHSQAYEEEPVKKLMARRRNISCVRNPNLGHPGSLMTYDQALMVMGFFGA